MTAVHNRLRFLRHFYLLLLKFNWREPTNTTVTAVVDEILKATHVCSEILNSSLQTISLGVGYGTSISN